MADTNEATAANTVYVHCDFPKDFDEEKLMELFKGCGTVEEGTLLRRPKSGDLKGYGFVKFQSNAGAKMAVETMNNALVGDCRIGVVYSTSSGTKPKKVHEEVGENNSLFVRQLAYKVKRKQLGEAFSGFGEVMSVRVSQRGYGFVEFTNVEDAKKAKEAMDGKELMGKQIAVLFAKPRPPKPEKKEEPKAQDNDDEQQEAGAPKKRKRRKRNRKKKKTADTEETPEEQVEQQPRQPKPKRKLFLKHLGENASVPEEDIRQHLRSFGEIQKCKVISKEVGVFCYVTMADADGAAAAKASENATVSGCEFSISWAPSVRRRQKKKKAPEESADA